MQRNERKIYYTVVVSSRKAIGDLYDFSVLTRGSWGNVGFI